MHRPAGQYKYRFGDTEYEYRTIENIFSEADILPALVGNVQPASTDAGSISGRSHAAGGDASPVECSRRFTGLLGLGKVRVLAVRRGFLEERCASHDRAFRPLRRAMPTRE